MSERLWFKIGEASEIADVSPRDIRYWEKIIPEIRPRRSKGNLRYYHRDDLPKLRAISLWIKQGFAVADCRELLLNGCVTRDLGLDLQAPDTGEIPIEQKEILKLEQRVQRSSQESDSEIKYTTQVSASKLKRVIDSLKDLLSRLQQPVP